MVVYLSINLVVLYLSIDNDLNQPLSIHRQYKNTVYVACSNLHLKLLTSVKLRWPLKDIYRSIIFPDR